MRSRLTALIAVSALAAAACQSVRPSTVAPTAPIATPSVPTRDIVVPNAVASCESSDPNGPDTGGPYAPTAGRDGGTLVIGDRHGATAFNPINVITVADEQLAAATSAGLANWTGEFLVSPNLSRDAPPTIDNGRVQTPGTDGYAMTVTWCLRPGLRWSDGAPLTCDDFEFAREWLRDVSVPAAQARYGDLSAIRCSNENVLVAQYGSVFSDYYTEMVPPLPRHHLESIPLDQRRAGVGFRPADLPRLPVSGPFAFASVTPDEVRLVRNPYYVGGFRGRPAYLDSLILRGYPSDAAVIEAFARGEIDLGTNLDETDVDSLKVPGLEEHVSSVPSLVDDALEPNWSARQLADGSGGCSMARAVASRGPGCPVADPAIRAAITQAIDVEAVATALTGIEGAARGSFVSPDAYYFSDSPPPTFDVIAARQGLDTGGWLMSTKDGIRSKDGLRARMELCTEDSGRWPAAAALIATELRSVGLDVVVHAVSAAALLAPFGATTRTSPCALARSNFDLALRPEPGSIETSGYRLRYHSSAFEPNGQNDARVSDPAIDAALDKAVGVVDFVVIKHAMADFQKAAVDSHVELPLTFQLNFNLVADQGGGRSFRNFFQGVGAPLTWNAADWYMGP